MSLSLFGLGLGWNLSYVAATTELVSLAAPAERGRLVGFTDLLSSLTGAALALLGGVAYSGLGIGRSRSARPCCGRAGALDPRARPSARACCDVCCYHRSPADARPPLLV